MPTGKAASVRDNPAPRKRFINDQNTLSSGANLAYDTVHKWVTDFYMLLPNLIVGFVILLLFGLLAYSISRFIRAVFERRERIDLGVILAAIGFWGILIFGVLVALTIIVPSLKPSDMLASLGIGSLAIGFAFKDILQNWLAGLLILLRLPFRRGDQIRVGEAEGTVWRIEPRATIIRTYDGRDIVVPNTEIYTSMVLIHTSQSTRRVEMEITVGYDYDVRQIMAIIQNSFAKIDEILDDPPPQILCWELGATSLALKLRWWISAERSNEILSRARAVQAIKESFEANDIDPTDPQLIFYQNTTKPVSFDTSAGHRPENATVQGPITETPPPPVFAMSSEDPETYYPKRDEKTKTLLPED